ncbi:MAG TPA: beta-propeller fold lactonase family protein [Candidatus Sulfotelmatobacter sp.]
MLKKVAGLILIAICTTLGLGCKGSESHYVYAALPSSNQIGIYREDPNSGVLTQLADSPFAAGNAPQSVAVHPSKKFLYVANSGENTISLFNIASNGEITEVTPRTPAGSSPGILAMDPGGAFLYEGDSGSNSISVYSIDASSGALTAIPASFTHLGSITPLNMKVNPAGNVLYVIGPGSPRGFLLAFSLASGVLTSIGTFSSEGANPYGLFIDSKGSFLYVTNAAPDNSIAEYAVAADGTVSELSGSPFAQSNGVDPLSVLVEPSGKYMYVANEGSANLSAYTVASDGSIDVLATPTFTTGTQPTFLLADPNGKYILVGNHSGGIQVFSLDLSTGDLTSVTTFSIGSNPNSLAITQ